MGLLYNLLFPTCMHLFVHRLIIIQHNIYLFYSSLSIQHPRIFHDIYGFISHSVTVFQLSNSTWKYPDMLFQLHYFAILERELKLGILCSLCVYWDNWAFVKMIIVMLYYYGCHNKRYFFFVCFHLLVLFVVG